MKVKFTLYYDGASKIDAIRTIRSASGYGLKDAKDFVDIGWENSLEHGCRKHPTPVIMSEAQFSRLASIILIGKCGINPVGLLIRGVEVINTESAYDFSSYPDI